jgi:pimeloyl-ACP methyl ester carboxylesterase
VIETGERVIKVNGVELGLETFGDSADAPILLIGNSMLTWADELCARLAARERFVVRYDLRDTGQSTTKDPDAPAYTLRDLVADAAALLEALGVARAHVVGFGPGGWIAQLLALDQPAVVATLTLVGTRPTAPGPNDPDLPEHRPELMAHIMSAPEPQWADREAAIHAVVEGARHLAGSAPFDEAEARTRVGRIYDRTVDAAPDGVDLAKRHRANQMTTQFAAIDSGDRWRERLGTITAPTLVVHGEDDPFFPIGNAEALAREITGAELERLPATGQELPRRVWDEFVEAVLGHTSGR